MLLPRYYFVSAFTKRSSRNDKAEVFKRTVDRTYTLGMSRLSFILSLCTVSFCNGTSRLFCACISRTSAFLYILLIIYGMFDIVNAVGCCTMKMFSLSLCFAVHFPVAPCCLRNRYDCRFDSDSVMAEENQKQRCERTH